MSARLKGGNAAKQLTVTRESRSKLEQEIDRGGLQSLLSRFSHTGITHDQLPAWPMGAMVKYPTLHRLRANQPHQEVCQPLLSFP